MGKRNKIEILDEKISKMEEKLKKAKENQRQYEADLDLLIRERSFLFLREIEKEVGDISLDEMKERLRR